MDCEKANAIQNAFDRMVGQAVKRAEQKRGKTISPLAYYGASITFKDNIATVRIPMENIKQDFVVSKKEAKVLAKPVNDTQIILQQPCLALI